VVEQGCLLYELDTLPRPGFRIVSNGLLEPVKSNSRFHVLPLRKNFLPSGTRYD
jgi:hypothetical protein